MSSHQRRRALPALVSAMLLGGGLTVVTAAPAFAAQIEVATASELQAALSNGVADNITLTADISAASTAFTTGTSDFLDLDGHVLTTAGWTLAPFLFLVVGSTAPGGVLNATGGSGEPGIRTTDASLTIDSGTVTVQGGEGAAGIGGGAGEDGGSVTIYGGTVTATGGPSLGQTGGGAGIGGGPEGDNREVWILGGTVTATGGEGGAGIGGGAAAGAQGGRGGVVTIDGGTVNATGTLGGAGIGGGHRLAPASLATGGTVAINGTAVVHATGGTSIDGDGAGIGGGANGNGGTISISGTADVTATASSSPGNPVGWGEGGTDFGSLSVDGSSQLRLEGTTTWPNLTVTGTGTISGNATLTNNGSIQPNVTLGGLMVTGNHFVAQFRANHPGAPPAPMVNVYATTFAAGARAFPAVPVRLGWTFTGWNTAADGSGVPFTTATVLGASIVVYAQWTHGTTSTMSGPTTVTAGTSGAYTLTQNGGDVTSYMTFSTTDPAAIVTGNSIEFRTAGAQTVIASSPDDPGVDYVAHLTVTPAVATSLHLTSFATNADQGGSISVTATAEDSLGNSTDVTSQVTLTSDVATDVISGNTVTFPHASPHTITVTLGALSTSFLVQVKPTASGSIAFTGQDAAPVLALGTGLLLLGSVLAGAVAVIRRVRRGTAA